MNHIEHIGDNAFSGCSSLRSILLPTTLQTIGKSAFDNCSTLKYIFIFRGVEYIGYQAFSGCESLKLISIKEELRQENLGLSNTINIMNDEDDSSSLYEFGRKLRKGSGVKLTRKKRSNISKWLLISKIHMQCIIML